MDDKRRQVRLTFEDVLGAQTKLLSLIRRKRVRNVGLSSEEEDEFPSLIAWSTLSHASTVCHFVNDDGRKTHFNIYSFALELKSLRGESVFLVDGPSGVKYKVPISKLWEFLEKELKNIFPYALEEAIHMSREAPISERATAHRFSMEQEKY
jgi:hypothetical protein